MKVFISQPMRDKTNEQIEKERNDAISYVYNKLGAKEVEVIDSFFKNAPHEANFLKLDCSKLKSTFGWKPRWHMAECMQKTVSNPGEIRLPVIK